MKIAVLFGSQSDEYIYDQLVKSLQVNHEVLFEVISAHRNPDRLSEFLKTADYDAVCAGAGLAAHLPGVVASQIHKPVFGLPVAANFGGLDALLSIVQMPANVPVLGLPPKDGLELAPFIDLWQQQLQEYPELKSIHVVVAEPLANYEYSLKLQTKLEKLAKELEIELSRGETTREGVPNIIFVGEKEKIQAKAFAIHIPVMSDSERKKSDSAFVLYDWINQGGIWVGANRAENAFLGWVQLFNQTSQFSSYLQAKREGK